MRRATPLEQVQTVPLMRHVQGQVGRTVECSHRKGTERGLLPAFSTRVQLIFTVYTICEPSIVERLESRTVSVFIPKSHLPHSYYRRLERLHLQSQ